MKDQVASTQQQQCWPIYGLLLLTAGERRTTKAPVHTSTLAFLQSWTFAGTGAGASSSTQAAPSVSVARPSPAAAGAASAPGASAQSTTSAAAQPDGRNQGSRPGQAAAEGREL